MNFEDINTFLEVYRYNGISQAAESMFVAQSTVSQRVRRLEQEVGGEIFERKPGIRGIGLTARGEQLLPIAQRLEALSAEISGLTEREPVTSLSVGSITSVYDAILPELFCAVSAGSAGIRLSGLARRSVELYNMVQDGAVDMAFVSFEMSSFDLVCRPVFREDYYLIASKGLLSADGPVNPASMDFSRELYYSFSASFRKWHEQIAPRGSFPLMSTDTLAVYSQVARRIPFWSVCTASWVNYLLELGVDIDVFSMTAPPSPRITYLIRKKTLPVSAGKAGGLFEEALSSLISAERLYPIT